MSVGTLLSVGSIPTQALGLSLAFLSQHSSTGDTLSSMSVFFSITAPILLVTGLVLMGTASSSVKVNDERVSRVRLRVDGLHF